MNSIVYSTYVDILKDELILAMGCTEPIAIAFAAAKAREVLGVMPERCIVHCSGNIVKNVKGVIVPNSGGMKGIDVAAALGIIGGDASKDLAVLETVTQADIEQARQLLTTDFCQCKLIDGAENLHIIVYLEHGSHSSKVEIKDSHTNIVLIEKDGKVVFESHGDDSSGHRALDMSLLNVRDILTFADTVELADIEEVIGAQVDYNTAISKEGLNVGYGAEVGRTLLDTSDDKNVRLRARAAAAAASDARMGGSSLPVVINSGSGNQGIAVSLPVIEYANELGVSREKLFRALVVSNLISIHQKRYIGKLSAYCGAVSASCGSAVAISYLMGGGYDEACATITNTIANIGGMVCDGAKASCAAKIASALDASLMGMQMSFNKKVFQPGDGLVKQDIEETIASVGRMGREGMRSTDVEILHIMLES